MQLLQEDLELCTLHFGLLREEQQKQLQCLCNEFLLSLKLTKLLYITETKNIV